MKILIISRKTSLTDGSSRIIDSLLLGFNTFQRNHDSKEVVVDYLQLLLPSTVMPELDVDNRDALALAEYARAGALKFEDYDRVISMNYGYMQLLSQWMGKRAALYINYLPIWKDEGAKRLIHWLPYAQTVLVPTQEMAGAMAMLTTIGVSTSLHWAPTVVHLPPPHSGEVKSNWSWARTHRSRFTKVLWVGRDDEHKNPKLYQQLAEAFPYMTFLYASPTKIRDFECTPNMKYIGDSKVAIDKAMSSAGDTVFVSTSYGETYGFAIVDAGVNGLPVLVPDLFSFQHFKSVATVYEHSLAGLTRVLEAVMAHPECKIAPANWIDYYGIDRIPVEAAWSKLFDNWVCE